MTDKVLTGSVDILGELQGLLQGVGLSLRDVGGQVSIDHHVPVLDSCFPMEAIAAIGRLAPSVAAAIVWKQRSGRGQDLRCHPGRVVHELMPQPTLNGVHANDFNLKDRHYNGYNQNFVPTRDGRSVSMASVYAPMRDALIDVIGLPAHRPDAIREAVRSWDAGHLEDVASAAGAVVTMVRTEEEWRQHPQGLAMAQRPVVEIERVGSSPPEPAGSGTRPLSGVRAVGMARMLAGSATAMTLAEHGADVLNLWGADDAELMQVYLKGNLGMRSALVPDVTPAGKDIIRSLVAGSDIVFENRRDGAAQKRGLDFESCHAARPGIIHVSTRCYGHYGPWAGRAGFDPQALSAAGCAAAEGGLATPRYPPTRIVNDWVAAWLGAFGAMAALIRRARDGGSYRVRVSLARTTMWWMGLPRQAPGLQGTLPEPLWFEADTPMGRLRTIGNQIRFSETQPHFAMPLVPWGSSRPEWLPR
jgi:crotonobetainyl-CoA:carnitine CoA-transferase CaiB-like acyl-CoA transferase